MGKAEPQAIELGNSEDIDRPQVIGFSYDDGWAVNKSLEAGQSSARSSPSHGRSAREGAGDDVKKSRSRHCLSRMCTTLRVLIKVVALGLMAMTLCAAVIHWPSWAIEDAAWRAQVMSTLFIIGLFMVAIEDLVGVNKSAIMLLLAGTMWTFLAASYRPTQTDVGEHQLRRELERGLQDVGSVVLFLLPAMGIVESMDHFDGFAIVTDLIRRRMGDHSERLMPIICLLTFALSSIIDNLTATIVALKLLRILATGDAEWRRTCGGLAVVAANAGGAWSPIGDVTTTMLWIQGKITAPQTVIWLFLPSFVAGTLPFAGLWWRARRMGTIPQAADSARRISKCGASPEQEHEPLRLSASGSEDTPSEEAVRMQKAALALGIAFILLVPVLKMWTGLPPYLGMLLALGLFWIVTDMLGLKERSVAPPEMDRDAPLEHTGGPPQHGVVQALHKVDLTGLLFFTGVLLAVGALDSAGVLRSYAEKLVKICGHSPVALCSLLGISSAVVDNVPLVEAAIDMFSETPADDPLWQLVALAAGTGGSILSVGSIAGVTLMSMEGVGFIWYFQRIGLWAFLGFAGGIVVYQTERLLF